MRGYKLISKCLWGESESDSVSESDEPVRDNRMTFGWPLCKLATLQCLNGEFCSKSLSYRLGKAGRLATRCGVDIQLNNTRWVDWGWTFAQPRHPSHFRTVFGLLL